MHRLNTNHLAGNSSSNGFVQQSRFLAMKLAHRSFSATPLFPAEPPRQTLVSGELISTMVLERAAPVGFAGRVARREFGVDSRPERSATDSAAFPYVGNLWVGFCHTVEKPRGWRVGF
jgi:hypothetical protein